MYKIVQCIGHCLLLLKFSVGLHCSQNNVYKYLFLDKKRIDKHPRYINLKNIGNPSIKDMTDYDFINDTILEVIIKKNDYN